MATLEERMAALEVRLDTEAKLRGDLGTSMRAMRHLVQAIAITQGEHTSTLERHSESLLRLHSGVGEVIRMLEELTRRMGEPPAGEGS